MLFTDTAKISKHTVQYFIALGGNYCHLFHLSCRSNIINSKTDSSVFHCPSTETIVLYYIYPAWGKIDIMGKTAVTLSTQTQYTRFHQFKQNFSSYISRLTVNESDQLTTKKKTTSQANSCGNDIASETISFIFKIMKLWWRC